MADRTDERADRRYGKDRVTRDGAPQEILGKGSSEAQRGEKSDERRQSGSKIWRDAPEREPQHATHLGGDERDGREERHKKERTEMHQRHRKERRDMHGHHRQQHDDMHARHEEEIAKMNQRHEEEMGAEAPGVGEAGMGDGGGMAGGAREAA